MSELEEFAKETMAEADAATAEVTTEVPQTPEAVEVEADADEAKAADEGVEEGSTSEPETVQKPLDAPKEEKEESATIPIAALLDERDKRQKLQKKSEDLQAQLDALNKVGEATPLPDVLDDQEGFVAQIQREISQSALNTKISISRDLMSDQHSDYDEVESKFTEMAKDNPSLVQQMSDAGNPARFAYDTVKKAEKLDKLANVDDYEATLRAELETKIRAELTEKMTGELADTQGKIDSLTPSLANVRAEGGNTVPPVVIDDPLKTIFNR